MTFQTGFPAPIDYGVDTTGTGTGSRPDVVAGQTGNLDPSQRTWQKWFNVAAFALPPNGRFGNSPRTDAIRLPGMENIDFSVTKSVRFRESRTFEFRTEFFNLLNHFNPDPQTVGSQYSFAYFWNCRRRCSGGHYPGDPTGCQALLLIRDDL